MAKIILTADQTLMSEYNKNEFLGFAACSPRLVPNFLYTKLFCPPVKSETDGKSKRAVVAHCGTRKIEASLLEYGFSRKDVVVSRPQDLKKNITKETKVVGITTNDPLGLGPASTTFSDLTGSQTFNAYFFEKLTSFLRKYKLKIIVGGPGAWQLDDPRIRAKYGIDCVLIGEGEITAPRIFEKAVNGEELPEVVIGDVVPLKRIPLIRGATINGLVEISRGCGRGCRFCNPTMLMFRCLPIDRIIREVKINVAAGNGVLLHAEDVLRYGAKGPVPNERAVIELFSEVKKVTEKIGISHFALASVASKPELIQKISEILEIGKKNPWISGQTGIETGSPKLACKILAGKAAPFNPKNWPEVVKDAHEILKENHWVPCSTLIMGMPGEKPDDVTKTVDLVQDLREYKSLIVPLFFVPIGNLKGERFFRTKHMHAEHWKLFGECLEHDFHWIKEIADEHTKMIGIKGYKKIVIKLLIKVLEKRLRPFIKIMKEGKKPL